MKKIALSLKLMKRLEDVSVIRDYQKGQTILAEQAYINSIPVVLSGSLKVLRTDEDGREILLYYILPGESCIMSFLGSMHQEASMVKAIASEESEIMFVPLKESNILVQENPEWINYILRLYHTRFEELLQVIDDIAFRKMDERLLNLLHKKAAVYGTKTFKITHEELANELGTARVVISRLLKKMEEQSLATLGRNKITLLD